MMLALKYRLFPDREQERMLHETLETCRTVYNSFLNWRKHDYEVTGTSPNYKALAKAQRNVPKQTRGSRACGKARKSVARHCRSPLL